MFDILGAFLPSRRAASFGNSSGNVWYSSGKTQAGVVVDPEKALTYGACWAASRVLSEGESDRDLFTYRRSADHKSHTEAHDHPVYNLMRYFPNPFMGSTAFRGGRTLHQVNHGNGFAEIERERFGDPFSRPVALWPIHPGRVRVPMTGDKYANGQPVPEGAYLVRNNDGKDVTVLRENMLHIPGALTEDGIWGKGVVAYHRESLGLGLAGDRCAATAVGSGNMPRVVLIDPAMEDQEQRRSFRQQFREMHGSPDAGDVAILWHQGSELKPLSFSASDSQFLESREFTERQIAGIYRVPPHMIGDLIGSKYATVEALGLEFVIYHLFPWCKKWEEQCNLKLFNAIERQFLYVQHDFNGLLRGDMMARMNAYQKAITIGVMTINECRRFENLNGIGPAGDENMFPLNMGTVGQIVAGGGKPGAGPGSDHAGFPAEGGGNNQDGAALMDSWTRRMLASDASEITAKLTALEESMRSLHRAAMSPVPGDKSKPKKKQLRAARAVLVDALGRVLTKEANAAERAAAGKGDFNIWIGEFYIKHEPFAVSALASACELATSLGRNADAGMMAKAMADASRALLTDAYPNKTPEDFAAMLAAWPTERAESVADGIFKKD